MRLLRLIVAALALGFAMAGPASAARLMAGPPADAMPCHEMAESAAAPAELPSLATPFQSTHLCCVMACFVVPPLALVDLAAPLWRVSLLLPVPERLPAGWALALPVPPPRPA